MRLRTDPQAGRLACVRARTASADGEGKAPSPATEVPMQAVVAACACAVAPSLVVRLSKGLSLARTAADVAACLARTVGPASPSLPAIGTTGKACRTTPEVRLAYGLRPPLNRLRATKAQRAEGSPSRQAASATCAPGTTIAAALGSSHVGTVTVVVVLDPVASRSRATMLVPTVAPRRAGAPSTTS